MRGQLVEAAPERDRTVAQGDEGVALEVAFRQVHHDRRGALDRVDVAPGVLAGARGERQVIGVGGEQGGVEGLARLAQRRADQGIGALGRGVDDGVKAGHVAGRAQHLGVVGLRDGGAHGTQVVEAADEALGDLDERAGRLGDHRIEGRLRAEPRGQGFAPADDLGEHAGAGLVEVAVNEALQPARLAVEGEKEPLRFPGLAQLAPGGAQLLGAVEDQDQEDQAEGRVDDRDAENAPADGDGAHPPLDEGRPRRPARLVGGKVEGGQAGPHSALRMRATSPAMAPSAGSRP
jgi:hypothetical protein